MPKLRLDPIALETGDCYLIRRAAKPPVKIRITRVARGVSKAGEQPTASYVRLDANDNPRRGALWEPGPTRVGKKKTHYQAFRTVLTWRDGAWRLPYEAEPVGAL